MVPPDTPVTTPVAGLTVAIIVLALLQVPPGVGSLKVVVNPAQTTGMPVIGRGVGLTVTVVIALQTVPVTSE